MSSVATVETAYEQHRDYVLAVLDRRCGWLDRDDRQAIYHDAYALLLEKERSGDLDVAAMHPQQVRAYLLQTALYKALDEGKRAERKRTQPMGDDALAAVDPDALPEQSVSTTMEGARLREIVDELPERRQAIVKLRFFFDRAPGEIQRLLGIRERVYRRELERAMRYIAERYELVLDGSFCESRRSLILAFVAGVAGPNRARQAKAHLDTCPACRHWAAQLRDAAGEVAAALPAPALAAHGDRLPHVTDLLGTLKAQLTEASATVKQHATALATRVDQTSAGYTAAARPGTVAIAVAGCLTVGGGATYCALEGLPTPMRALVEPAPTPHAQARDRPAKRTTPRRPPAQPASSQAGSPTASKPPTQREPTRAQRSTPASSTPPPTPVQREFGPAGSGSPSAQPATSGSTQAAASGTSSSSSVPPPPPPPPPAPASGPPGEFDP